MAGRFSRSNNGGRDDGDDEGAQKPSGSVPQRPEAASYEQNNNDGAMYDPENPKKKLTTIESDNHDGGNRTSAGSFQNQVPHSKETPPQDTTSKTSSRSDERQNSGQHQGSNNNNNSNNDERALDAYLVGQRRPKKREVIQGEAYVAEPTTSARTRMSNRTLAMLVLVAGILVAVICFLSIFLGLRDKPGDEAAANTAALPPQPPTVVVIVETDPPEPTSSPIPAPPTTQPTTSFQPTSIPTALPTSEVFPLISTVLELLYDVYYEGLELDLSDRNSPQAKAATWIIEEDQFVLASADALGADNLDIDFVYMFAERYSLAVLYFATNGNEWTEQCNFLNPQTHVCDWKCSLPQALIDASINPIYGDGDLTDLIGLVGDEMGVFCVKDILDDSTGIEDLWESVLSLRLVFGGLQGYLPIETIQGLQIVIEYNLAFNELTGSIPWAHFASNLYSFVAPVNRLEGSLASDIGKYTNLDTLQIGSNLITGTIPTEISGMTSLQFLYAEDNLMTGTIPDEIDAILDTLYYLNMEFNFLTGTLPSFLFRTTGLGLSFAVNELSGTFPEVPFGYQIEGFDLRNNSLTGTLPESIGRLTNLQAASLAGNDFTGSIPDSFGALSLLQILRLDDNQFSGKALEGSIFTNMASMIFWVMNDNNFSGTIAGENFSNHPLLETALLSRNSLSGTIPVAIGDATNLVDLHLDENYLSGRIPSSILNLRRLQTLTLNSNSLSGDLEETCIQAEANLQVGQVFLQVFNFTADCPDEVVCDCCTICCDMNDMCTTQ